MTRITSLLLVLMSFASALLAEESWLPSQTRESLTIQLAEGIHALYQNQEKTEEEQLAGARKGIALMEAKLVAVGLEKVLLGAPRFEGIELPPTENRYLMAFAAYGLCTLPLHQELAANAQEKFYVAFGEVAVVMITAYLRSGYLTEGGTEEALRAYLTQEELVQMGDGIQLKEARRAHVNERCAPALQALL